MMAEVRSDFTVSLRIMDPDGRVRTIAKHHAEVTEIEDGFRGLNPVPHLHRVSPDEAWLASFDADDSRFFLSALSEEGTEAERSFVVEGIEGRVRQFRWVDGHRALVLSTEGAVYLVPIPGVALADSLPTEEVKVDATSVFAGMVQAGELSEPAILDLRWAPGGFFARVYDSSFAYWDAQRIYYARVSDGAVQELDDVLPSGVNTNAAVLGAHGELVAVVSVDDEERFPEGRSPLQDEQELWRFAIRERGEPEFAGRMPCPGSYCDMTNWAPASEPLVAVHSYSEIVSYANSEEPELFEFDETDGGVIDSLWAWPEGGWVAASGERVRSFDETGRVLWTWKAPGDQVVHGVHIAPGGQTVLVAAGLELYRVKAGKSKRLLRSRARFGRPNPDADVWEGVKESFVDQALELPDGSIAFTVVDLEQSYEMDAWEPEASVAALTDVPVGVVREHLDEVDHLPAIRLREVLLTVVP
jgi:hypothetical protein